MHLPMDPIDLPFIELKDKGLQKQVEELLQSLMLDDEDQDRMQKVFLLEMDHGLRLYPDEDSSLQMENTFIPELLNGTESGEYLALDLGGTNFRVIMINMVDGKCVDEVVEYYEVLEELRLGEGTKLFDFLASCIADFFQKKKLPQKNYKLGFTFSFPMAQQGLDVGILVSWTKSFNCPGVVGEDAVKMLNDAISRRKDLDITVTAVLNDTTGTLVMGSYMDPRCAIGMILGTGSNACYLEKVDKVERWEGQHLGQEVIIDIEWGAFGDNNCLDWIKTDWDRKVDEKSLLVNSFTFEKYFSGKYLGDLVREILLDFSKKGLFCNGSIGLLETHGAIKASDVASVETGSFRGNHDNAKDVLKSLQLPFTDDDICILKYVCGMASYRGVLLVSLLTSTLLKRMKRPYSTIAIDGSLYKNHPRFKPLMQKLISFIVPCNLRFSLMLTEDGSGKGAALVAAIVDRLKSEN